MTYCEASFAKKSKNAVSCGELSTHIVKWFQQETQFIYYLCDFHSNFLKILEPENVELEEYIGESKKSIYKHAVFR